MSPRLCLQLSSFFWAPYSHCLWSPNISTWVSTRLLKGGVSKTELPCFWRFWTVMLQNTLDSPLDCKEIKQVNPKGNQSWIFTGRVDAEAETPILWPPDAKSQLIRKDPDAGKDWRQKEKGMTEDEMVGWHHWLNGQVWASSGRWRRKGRPNVLQSMELQRVRHN